MKRLYQLGTFTNARTAAASVTITGQAIGNYLVIAANSYFGDNDTLTVELQTDEGSIPILNKLNFRELEHIGNLQGGSCYRRNTANGGSVIGIDIGYVENNATLVITIDMAYAANIPVNGTDIAAQAINGTVSVVDFGILSPIKQYSTFTGNSNVKGITELYIVNPVANRTETLEIELISGRSLYGQIQSFYAASEFRYRTETQTWVALAYKSEHGLSEIEQIICSSTSQKFVYVQNVQNIDMIKKAVKRGQSVARELVNRQKEINPKLIDQVVLISNIQKNAIR